MTLRISTSAFFLSAALLLLTVAACDKTKNEKTAFAHGEMLPWFNDKCASCHGSGGSNKGSWFFNPSDYEGSIKNNISRINQVVYTFRSMPPGGLTQSELDRFKAWYDNGYPAR